MTMSRELTMTARQAEWLRRVALRETGSSVVADTVSERMRYELFADAIELSCDAARDAVAAWHASTPRSLHPDAAGLPGIISTLDDWVSSAIAEENEAAIRVSADRADAERWWRE